ncbi:ribonuclease G [Clostridium sp. DSM 8431]|uniref:Rne/Rng family ribonuclease n=1 Tax=Clostridium sp. DSM 8431 TaxID=1761781 RepID=UPI0008EBD8C3|nr:Rne/Rng family ribonuclease [Clostridium sp. DSM 8431]SFU54925.1 ribonuclease G [Clostridium sp. DSM 8431]
MKEILIERREATLRVAIKVKGKLMESIVDEETSEPRIGELYKGRVKNIIPGTNSIFVDLGLDKEGYLYYSNELKKSGIKKGQEILVEVIKEPLNEKGAKLSTKYGIASKYMVLEKGRGIDFSVRFKDEVKKELIAAELPEVEDAKLIVRTEAGSVSIEELIHERNLLVKEYEEIKRRMKYSTKLGKLYGENLVISKVLRDKVGLDGARIIVNDEKDYEFIKNYIKDDENVKLQLFDKGKCLFDFYDIERELLKLRHRKVVLPCGGSIVIDKTEAMHVIDVNSGKNIKERSFEKTILETNIEAAREIGRQILLRNLSGIIVIDFIDLRDKADRALVMRELKEALKEDGGNLRVYPFTELNLVQISRKRIGKSMYEYMEEECPLCNGTGHLLKLSYLEGLIGNEIARYSSENGINDFFIEIEESYKDKIKGDLVSFLRNIDGLDKEIYINYVTGIEGYRIEPLIFQNQKKNIEQYLINLD